MTNKPARTVEEQLLLLKERGMLFKNESNAPHILKNISYYRLKGYWWDMQADREKHIFLPNSYFEEVVERYNFDRHLRLILFDAIELIEIALRTKMIYILSLSYGAYWYSNSDLFINAALHQTHLENLTREFNYSQEVFIKNHKRKHPEEEPESWKILEVSTMGTLSKLYKNLKHQLPEKSAIAKEMGLNIHSELSSWLEAIVYTRNIIAHHSRLWSRNMVKRPYDRLNNPQAAWFTTPLNDVQKKKPFLIISTMIYLCNKANPVHTIKMQICDLIGTKPNVPIYKLGFIGDWKSQPVWE